MSTEAILRVADLKKAFSNPGGYSIGSKYSVGNREYKFIAYKSGTDGKAGYLVKNAVAVASYTDGWMTISTTVPGEPTNGVLMTDLTSSGSATWYGFVQTKGLIDNSDEGSTPDYGVYHHTDDDDTVVGEYISSGTVAGSAKGVDMTLTSAAINIIAAGVFGVAVEVVADTSLFKAVIDCPD